MKAVCETPGCVLMVWMRMPISWLKKRSCSVIGFMGVPMGVVWKLHCRNPLPDFCGEEVNTVSNWKGRKRIPRGWKRFLAEKLPDLPWFAADAAADRKAA